MKAYLIEKRFINFLVNINFAIYFLLTAKLIENYGKPMIETHEKLYIFSFLIFYFIGMLIIYVIIVELVLVKPSTYYFKWKIIRNFNEESMNKESQIAIKDGEADWAQNLNIVFLCLIIAVMLVSIKLGFENKNDPFIQVMQRYLETEDIKGITEVSLLVTAAVLGACISNLFNVITSTKRQVSKILEASDTR